MARVARNKGVISEDELAILVRRNALRDIVIRVDEFDFDLSQQARSTIPPVALVA